MPAVIGTRPADIRSAVPLTPEAERIFSVEAASFKALAAMLDGLWDDPDADVDGLQTTLSRVEALFPEEPRAPFAMGYLKVLAGHKSDGLTCLQRAISALEAGGTADAGTPSGGAGAGVMEILSVMLQAFPDDVGVAQRLAVQAQELGRPKDAAAALLMLGRAFRAKNIKKAIGHLRQAFDLDPASRDVALELCDAMLHSGEGMAMGEVVTRALSAWPDEPRLILYKGIGLVHAGRGSAGEKLIVRALDMARPDPALTETLGRILAAQGLTDYLPARAPGGPVVGGGGASTGAGAGAGFAGAAHGPIAGPLPPVRLGGAGAGARAGVGPLSPPASGSSPAAMVADDLYERITRGHPRLGADVRSVRDLETTLAGRPEGTGPDDRLVLDLLKKLEAIGDKLKLPAPADAAAFYEKARGHLMQLRDPVSTFVWKDELDRRLTAVGRGA